MNVMCGVMLSYYILVVVCLMENSEGKFLTQKRSVKKDGLCGTTMN